MKKLFFVVFTLLSLNAISQRLEIIHEDGWKIDKWENVSIQKKYFQENGLLDSTITFTFDGITPLTKRVFTYFSDGKLETEIYQWYSTSKQEWEDPSRTTFIYNDSFYSIIELKEQLYDSVWQRNSRILKYYDSSGKILFETTQSWNQDHWNNSYKMEHFYNSPLIKGFYYLDWNFRNNTWDSSGKTIEINNSDGDLIETKKLQWSGQNWKNILKTVYSYKTKGILDSINIYRDDSIPSNYHRAYYFYGIKGLEYIIYQYTNNENNWLNSHRYRYDYYQVLSQNSSINNSISIYPNPANQWVKIKLEEDKNSIEIFDLKGNKVLNDFSDKGEKELDISKLSSGLYLLRVQNANGILSQKLLIN